MSNRLYKIEWVWTEADEEQPDEYGIYPSDYVNQEPMPDPEGWTEFCQEKWGEYKPFFYPSTQRIYKSRSAAQRRVDIINHWGGNAVVLECTPQWETVEAANKRREYARISARIKRKQSELNALYWQRGDRQAVA